MSYIPAAVHIFFQFPASKEVPSLAEGLKPNNYNTYSIIVFPDMFLWVLKNNVLAAESVVLAHDCGKYIEGIIEIHAYIYNI